MQRLLAEGYIVTGVDNFSRGNRGAIDALQRIAGPERFLFLELDLGDRSQVGFLDFQKSFNLCHVLLKTWPPIPSLAFAARETF